MAFDFSNYLRLSDSSTGCDAERNSEPNDVSNTGNARVKRCGSQPNGICNGRREPSSWYPGNVQKIVTDDDNDDIFEKALSKRHSAEVTLPNERVPSNQRSLAWQTGSQETLSWNDKLERLSKTQLRLGSNSSAGDLRKLLQRLKTMMKMCPTGLNDPDPGGLVGGDPDCQDPDRTTQRQPAYRSRRSLPGRLTDDHVSPAKHETKKKFSRRGSVKFADEFGLNLNTFVMIPSRFSAQAHNDINWNRHLDNRKWNSDDLDSVYIHRNTATDGFRGMGRQWDLANDLGLFLLDNGDDKTLWPDWDLLEFRSLPSSLPNSGKEQLHDDDFHDPSNHRRFSREKRSSKQEVMKPETSGTEVAKLEAEAEVNGRRHEFHLCFEQPFADLDGFQRKLRENFLCLENVRVDDRSKKSGDDNICGTGPSRKEQGTTILCSIKVRHTDGGAVTVFSRCTDNDWVTYADLPAQHLSGVTNLGFDYDTFCFAVSKQVQQPREEDVVAGNAGPTSAVEFALCCRVTKDGGTISHWDNNGGANYRIEWFDN